MTMTTDATTTEPTTPTTKARKKATAALIDAAATGPAVVTPVKTDDQAAASARDKAASRSLVAVLDALRPILKARSETPEHLRTKADLVDRLTKIPPGGRVVLRDRDGQPILHGGDRSGRVNSTALYAALTGTALRKGAARSAIVAGRYTAA